MKKSKKNDKQALRNDRLLPLPSERCSSKNSCI